MRRSITPPALTASTGLDVTVVSSSSVSPEPARASREGMFSKEIEDVILVKFVLLVSVHTTSVVLSRMDYCNSLYAGISQSSFTRLQMVQNAADRFLTGVRKHQHITPILMALNWLPVRHRVDFKILMFVLKSLNGLAPSYLSELLNLNTSGRCLRSTNSYSLSQPRT